MEALLVAVVALRQTIKAVLVMGLLEHRQAAMAVHLLAVVVAVEEILVHSHQ